MTNPEESYPVNTIPALSWAFDLYFRHNGRFRDTPIVELIFPAGKHKEMMRKTGAHEILLLISKRRLYVRARCIDEKDCNFNTDRIDGKDRAALMKLSWDEIDSRKFFVMMTKWLMKLNIDSALMIRALNTVCDGKVVTPLKTQYGRVFEKFDDYRRNRWPEDATPDKMDRFLQEVIVRVAFWFQSAAAVGALK